MPNARLGLQVGGVSQTGEPAMVWEFRDGEEQRWRLEAGKHSNRI